jgi:hypothetical protein
MRFLKIVALVQLIVLSLSCKINKTGNEGGTNNPGIIDTSSVAGKYQLEEAFPNLEFDLPLELTSPNDGSSRVFVVEQGGVVKCSLQTQTLRRLRYFLTSATR